MNMSHAIDNASAILAVRDLDASATWYETLFGRPGASTVPEVREWSFPHGGALQIYQGPDRAGQGSCTLKVGDLDAQIAKLDSMGVDTRERPSAPHVRTVMVTDPDGNHLAFAQAAYAVLPPKTSQLSRACLQAYVDKDREAAERMIAPDFHFTSPLDNAIDRAKYFERCWPNSRSMHAVEVVESVDDGDRAFLVYEVDTGSKRFRNCEMHMSRGGKLVSVEVYFGWDLPHPARPGGFVDNAP
jgi:predicted enzyme related to lactoylglutathione lyase